MAAPGKTTFPIVPRRQPHVTAAGQWGAAEGRYSPPRRARSLFSAGRRGSRWRCRSPRSARTQNVLGEKGRRIRELTAVVQKRFGFPEGSVELYAEKVATRGLCAIAQAESLRYKLLGGLAVRRACYGVLRFIMESGAKGCEVVVSGKLRGQRAKSMKFVDGLMIHSGDPVNYYVDTAVRHVLLRQGVLGIKVKIMLPWDPSGKIGPKKPLPDHVSIVEPKEEILPTTPISEQKGGKPEQPAMPQPVPTA
uniref:DNA-(apurinic or apyrimidinic site) lyase n=1 Tax=Anser cygnoides TaxID=8845 RepID=A0A8B9EMU9_ANSCY